MCLFINSLHSYQFLSPKLPRISHLPHPPESPEHPTFSCLPSYVSSVNLTRMAPILELQCMKQHSRYSISVCWDPTYAQRHSVYIASSNPLPWDTIPKCVMFIRKKLGVILRKGIMVLAPQFCDNIVCSLCLYSRHAVDGMMVWEGQSKHLWWMLLSATAWKKNLKFFFT